MQELDIAVNAGLPKRSLVLLSSRLYCDDRAASAFKFQVIPPATWKRRTKRLSRQESERIERLARTLADAEHVFDDRDDARQWMSAPHKELNGKTPIETARTEIGADCNQFRHPLQSYAATAATLCYARSFEPVGLLV
jgi:putative toxin-antitoxin system antitoxin component (TIGR02293 family)